jgi:8-oxo-dGTP pyrophosphatase MutT (NUDIX family)
MGRRRTPERCAVSAPADNLRLSATVLLLRETAGRLEVLMQRRAATLAFGGTWAFPGGAVDPADGDPCQDLAGTVRRAAIRECNEEACVRLCAETAASSMVGWSRWITPAGRMRRFDTWFFATALPPGQAVAGDSVEVVESLWIEPMAAIEARAGGRMPMMPPAVLSLIDLQMTFAQCRSLERLLEQARGRATPPILPRLTQREGNWIAVYPWDPEYVALGGAGVGADTGVAVPEHLRALPSRMTLAENYSRGLHPAAGQH